MKIITDNPERLGQWLLDWEEAGERWSATETSYIGVEGSDGKLRAVVSYNNFNEANIHMHITAAPGSHWFTRNFLWYCFYYPFEQLGCKRVTGIVSSSNKAAQRLDEHLGFKLEATLKDAHPLGDLLIYSMTKAECRWLTLRRN